ncbi:hypothetical protein B0H16DRAFT_1593534 [Mycena metata]|uniref:C2H2-type domain-containing protein n=1 Tax=Mycena metata TaxID=1033252 RepID=A0AAD7HS12_9AGAR|nr:hypothetical protein B0H16DRAFT_1593534 [Mycena metata]
MNFGSSDHCYPSAPSLFIQPSDSPNPSELSPLDDFAGGFSQTDLRYSPSTSGRNSPIDGWSPVSSFSGDVFPDDLSEELGPWAQQHLSGHSSPALSPSLSPITDALDGLTFRFDEHYPGVEQSVLPSGAPSVSRLRSSSHSVQSVSPAEVWTDGVGRGRSASFTASTNDHQFYPNAANSAQHTEYANVQISVPDSNVTFHESFGSGINWGMSQTENASGSGLTLGHLAANWEFPGASSGSLQLPPSPSLLTVPTGPSRLQRRPACNPGTRYRSRSHSDLPSMISPDQDSGRGRGQHRSTLSIPNSRSVSNGSRASSRAASPHRPVFFSDVRTPASYSPSSPSSPAFEDAERGDGGISVERRHTLTTMRHSEELLPPVPALSRASSAPSSRGRRSKPAPSLRNQPGLNMFKAMKTESASSFLSSSGSDSSSQQEFRVSQPPSAASFKSEVASKKIKQASSKRRINVANFECPLETCSSTFTARHNLINHINSHNKYRPHRCMCGLSFTTQGVLNRHKKRCSK